MERRDYLKTAGGIGATGVAAGLGLATFASSGAAAAADLTIDDPAAVESDDGSIEWVAVRAYLRTEWDGFDEDVHYARYIDEVTIRPNDENHTYTIHETYTEDFDDGKDPGGDGWGGDGEHYSAAGKEGHVRVDVDWGIAQKDRENVYNEGYGLPADPAPVTDLEAGDDGETKESTVVLTKRVRLYGEGTNGEGTPNNPLTGPNSPWGLDDPTASDSITVAVTNEEATASSEGEGSAETGV